MPSCPTGTTRPPRTSPLPFVLGIILVLVAAAAAAYHYRERLGLAELLTPAEIWWEARVTTEPPGVEIVLELARLLAADDQGHEAVLLFDGLVERTSGLPPSSSTHSTWRQTR